MRGVESLPWIQTHGCLTAPSHPNNSTWQIKRNPSRILSERESWNQNSRLPACAIAKEELIEANRAVMRSKNIKDIVASSLQFLRLWGSSCSTRNWKKNGYLSLIYGLHIEWTNTWRLLLAGLPLEVEGRGQWCIDLLKKAGGQNVHVDSKNQESVRSQWLYIRSPESCWSCWLGRRCWCSKQYQHRKETWRLRQGQSCLGTCSLCRQLDLRARIGK